MGGIDEHLKLSNVSIPCLSLCLNFSEDTLPKYANNFSITWGREQCLSFLPLIALKSWSKTGITERERVCLVNIFYSLFSVFKNNFLFLKLKNLFDNQK